ncbi:MAG: T9SS type A sorting domain-containing protein [Bacteroidales bacterium]
MKTFTSISRKCMLAFMLFFSLASVQGQSYLVGPASPAVGTSANYTSHNHYNLFNVLHPTGIYIDSITIYPSTAATSYTVVIQNSAQAQIASYTGTSTVGGNQPERIKVNLFVPMGTGYRMGLTTGSVGMLRNQDGILFPYTVPNVITFTGATFGTTYWYFFYNIRVHLPITATDAGLTRIISPGDSVCSGLQPVDVVLKNYGPADLTATDIKWKVNNVDQTTYNWTGNIFVNDSAIVTIGQYNFLTGTSYDIKAYTHNPNNTPDTINGNDTVVRSGVFVKTSPTASTNATSIDICQGDTALIALTLTGTPPWSLLVQSGTTTIPFTNITTANPVVGVTPATSATFSLVGLSDATGCSVDPAITVAVNVFPAPPATITPQAGTAACQGDSVPLMATVGLNFTYEWYKDGVLIQGQTSFMYYARESGTYTLKVTTPIGCSATSAPISIFIHPIPDVNLGNDTVLLPGQTVLLDAGAGYSSYLWSTGATSQTIQADSTGTGVGVKTVWVQVTDNNGCQGGDTILINFSNNPGITEPERLTTVRVIPNPASDQAEVLLNGYTTGEVMVKIFSTDGRLADHRLSAVDDGRVLIDVSKLPVGSYLIKLSSEQLNSVCRLIIQR